MRQPTTRPVSDMMMIVSTLLTTSAVVRPTSTADGAIGSDRNRSMMPGLDVLRHAGAGDGGAEDHRLGEDPGDEELAVGAGSTCPARQRDRPAEHVGEQQDEHDRADDRADQQVGDPLDLDEVAPGDGPAVAERLERAGGTGPLAGRRQPGPGGVGGAVRCSCGGSSGLLVLGRVAGEGEEHVVEGGAPDAGVEHLDPGGVEGAQGVDELLTPPLTGAVRVRVCSSTPTSPPRRGRPGPDGARARPARCRPP